MIILASLGILDDASIEICGYILFAVDFQSLAIIIIEDQFCSCEECQSCLFSLYEGRRGGTNGDQLDFVSDFYSYHRSTVNWPVKWKVPHKKQS